MRATMLLTLLAMAACAPQGTPLPHPPGTPNPALTAEQGARETERLAQDREARLRAALERERLEEMRAQSFGIEARMTRLAMACADPQIRRVAYATADLQSAAFERLIRRSPRLAQISAAEETRLRNQTYGAVPSPAQCRQLLVVMGESAKAIRDGER